MLYEIIIFQCDFYIFVVFWLLRYCKQSSPLSTPFQIVSQSNIKISEYITHDRQVSNLEFVWLIIPLYVVESVEPNQKALRISL